MQLHRMRQTSDYSTWYAGVPAAAAARFHAAATALEKLRKVSFRKLKNFFKLLEIIILFFFGRSQIVFHNFCNLFCYVLVSLVFFSENCFVLQNCCKIKLDRVGLCQIGWG